MVVILMETPNAHSINAKYLTKDLLQEYVSFFSDYCRSFDQVDLSEAQKDNIDLKIHHTDRVRKNILDIGQSLNLNDESLILAEIIALFHDIGRFEQIKQFNTFSDSQSMDHGDYGHEFLLKKNILQELEENEREIVLDAVKLHNKFIIPPGLTDTTLLFVDLIRDADKIDIYEVLIPYYQGSKKIGDGTVVLNLKLTSEITPDVIDGVISGSMVNKNKLKTVNDFKILQLAWIHDINFPRSKEIIKMKGYVETIIATLPKTPRVAELSCVLNKALQ